MSSIGPRPEERPNSSSHWSKKDARPWRNGKAEPFENDEMRARDGYEAPGGCILPPPPDRGQLLLSAWMNRVIPPRDHLLGGVMCTTSRWFIFSETGIGKTLLFMDLGGAILAAKTFLNCPDSTKRASCISTASCR